MNETRDRDNFTPEGWHTVTPRIVVHEAQHLVEFVKYVFRATGEYRPHTPSVLTMGDSIVMISEAGIRDPTPAFLYVYVENTGGFIRLGLVAAKTKPLITIAD